MSTIFSLSLSLSLSLSQWFMTLFIMFINVVVGIEGYSACSENSVACPENSVVSVFQCLPRDLGS